MVLRVGILGLSASCEANALAFVKSSHCTVVAVACGKKETAQEWCATEGIHGGVTIYSSFNALIADPSVDAVYIAVPTLHHAAWCNAAANAGKHVLCEKPLAVDVAEAMSMHAVCEENNVVLMDTTMFVHHERTQRMLDAIRDERFFGPVKRCTAVFSFEASAKFIEATADPKVATDEPLGCVGDLGWFCARVGLIAFGPDAEVKSVQATLTDFNAQGVPLDVSGVVYFDAERQLSLHFHCSFKHPFRQWVEIVGRNKVLTCDDFVIPRATNLCQFEVESFPSEAPTPLIDHDSLLISVKHATLTSDCCQRTALIETFATLAMSDPYSAATAQARKTWRFAALETQAVVSAVIESIRRGGALISTKLETGGAKQVEAAETVDLTTENGSPPKRRRSDDESSLGDDHQSNAPS